MFAFLEQKKSLKQLKHGTKEHHVNMDDSRSVNGMYSIVCREMDLKTGNISVYEIETGTQNGLAKLAFNLKIRSAFNPELQYFLCNSGNKDYLMTKLKEQNIPIEVNAISVKL